MEKTEEKLSSISYSNIANLLTDNNFKSIKDNNYKKAFNAFETYYSDPLVASGISVFGFGIYASGFDGIDTIEEAMAIKKIRGDEYYFAEHEYIDIINGLKYLDKGYSKELADFFTKYMDRDTVEYFSGLEKYKEESDNLVVLLKKYNQLSALRAYEALKKKYNIKA
ncbi:hypothetical protein MLC35_10280 [Sulfurimonas sp. NW7]|uniref:hypothetical protein n=1 Tax=Sulfurimonas sp. NW7 TaxID=2922727 RepID=UPI003DA81747